MTGTASQWEGASWRKSSRSGGNANSDCVEMSWRKSSRSGGQAGNSDCVEIAFSPTVVGLRDSKNPFGPILEISSADWRTFLDTLR